MIIIVTIVRCGIYSKKISNSLLMMNSTKNYWQKGAENIHQDL